MEPRHAVERALDLLVFAPLGLLLSAPDTVPKLAEEGRRRMAGQAATARVLGELTVNRGRQEAAQVIDRARRQTTGVLAGLGLCRPGTEAVDPDLDLDADAGPAATTAAEGSTDGPSGPTAATAATAVPPTPAPVSVPPAATRLLSQQLAIPGYDSLSASQVVQRLPGLSPEELDAVRAYEQAGRARKTILLRIAQLQAPS